MRLTQHQGNALVVLTGLHVKSFQELVKHKRNKCYQTFSEAVIRSLGLQESAVPTLTALAKEDPVYEACRYYEINIREITI